MYSLLFVLFATFAQEIPLKPAGEFEIDLDYTFKERYIADRNTTVHLSETRAEYERRTSTGPLPYLVINVKLSTLNKDEARIRLIAHPDRRIYNNKRVNEGDVIPIDMGFTDDIKDRVAPHEYTLILLSPEKRETSRITLNIDEDGNFFVNGEKRGRF